MARIRSVHPGFFKDEDLLSVSMAARLLFLGLGTEADDKGVFEWKLITLKINIFPLDNIDMAALLEELVFAHAICRFEVGGKKYGAIRNFQRHQRPKKPNDIHPITDEIRNYVGSQPSGSVPVPHQDGNDGEKSPQMEDGGGRGNGKGSRVSNETLSPSPESESEGFSDFVKAYPQPDGVHAAEELWNEIVSAGTSPESILLGLKGACRAWKAKHGNDITWIPKAKTWLADKGWRDHAPAENATAKTWEGPPEVRKAIVAAIGPDAAKSCFEASEWDGDKIIPRTTWVFDKLRSVPGVKDILAPVRKAA